MTMAVSLLAAELAWAAGAKMSPVSKEDARQWLLYASPLPHKIDIYAKVDNAG